MFYLMARGLTHAEAERLIVRGFFEHVLDRIGSDEVREPRHGRDRGSAARLMTERDRSGDATISPGSWTQLRPAGVEIIDVHTHLGLDEDGMSLTPAELVEMLDVAGAERARHASRCTTPSVIPATACPTTGCWSGPAASGGRLIPFCRLDPAEDPVAEAERCLDAGARGIKLHPRAQAFALASTPGWRAIFALAEERQVPILIHAGRGLPPDVRRRAGRDRRAPPRRAR